MLLCNTVDPPGGKVQKVTECLKPTPMLVKYPVAAITQMHNFTKENTLSILIIDSLSLPKPSYRAQGTKSSPDFISVNVPSHYIFMRSTSITWVPPIMNLHEPVKLGVLVDFLATSLSLTVHAAKRNSI